MYKILLLGSGDFARGVLEGVLATEHQLVGFFPWEARAKPSLKSRLKRFLVSDNIALAQRLNLPLVQVRSANSPEFARYVESVQPDVILVAGWGEILRPEVIQLPKVACVNSHPSLLPRHRGAAPIASVLREGESETGVTFHYLTPAIDAGNILYQSSLPIFDFDDYGSLARRIAQRAKETIHLALANIGQEGQSQNQDDASYFYRPKGKDLWLDWSQPAQLLRNRICSVAPGSERYATKHGDRVLEVFDAELVDLHNPCDKPGLILGKSGSRLLVATGDSLRALFVRACPKGNRLGLLGAKYYCLNKIHAGEILGP
jgi:methionyl-tRNA formyltransferase